MSGPDDIALPQFCLTSGSNRFSGPSPVIHKVLEAGSAISVLFRTLYSANAYLFTVLLSVVSFCVKDFKGHWD